MTARSLPARTGLAPGRRSARRLAAAGGLALALLGAGPAAAQQAPLAGHDRSTPIEIVADTLVMEQEREIATFSGNVEAVQGEMTLKADLLRVFYTQQRAEGAADTAPEAGAEGAIRRIEAEGNVLIASPRETAQGDAGTYDVEGARVTLDGSVVLTQNENVIRGASLDMNLATGVSTVRAAPGAPRGERVRAVFVPGGGS